MKVSDNMSNRPTLRTPLCDLLGIEYPIVLAGMARTSSGPLAAAVSNAGGLGVIGGLGYTPQQMRDIIHEIKANLADKNLPFGVDLALPQVGGSARKTKSAKPHCLVSRKNLSLLTPLPATTTPTANWTNSST